MEKPSTSDLFNHEAEACVNLASLNLSLSKLPGDDNEEFEDEDDDEIEEIEVDENERLHLQKVTSFVEAAYQRVEKFSKQEPYQILSAAASESSSCASTVHHAASLPESLDGGKAEIEEIKNMPVGYESALRINQALQRRLTSTLTRLENTLEQNFLRQAQLKEEEEEQGLLNSNDKDSKEYRNKYFVRPSSFAIPYFKDRSGMPSSMNQDAKYKVDHGYLDLYSTRLRTWMSSEQILLVKQVQKEWKDQLINDWKNSLKNAERKLKNDSVSEEEKSKIEEEIKTCQNHINFFTNVSAEKIDIPKGAKLDWDKVSAQTFDGHRSTEECQLVWENHLHPSISQSPWTEDEDIEIQDSVLECKDAKPDWENIASSLNTGRTAFQVMQRWVSFIKPTIQPARWTAEGSKTLEDTINMLRVGSHIPWSQVSQHLTGYTKVQLQSRWRNINPDQSKGPFTPDEDFILIKGLYKFGMNFDLIAHFLPGRNRVQVRDRFKRAILLGLTSKPWSLKEDKKIIENCSLDSQHWRLMAVIMPNRETCQIRLRFYILHFWQSISKEKKLPPPLFPLSMTTKPSEVKKLREKIANFNPDVRIYLDKAQSIETVRKVNFSEERRTALCNRNKKKNLDKFLEEKPDDPAKPKLVRKRKRGCYGPRNKSWPDKALIEYFLPGRPNSSVTTRSDDENINNHIHSICQALQLTVKQKVDDTEGLANHVKIVDEDADLVNTNLVDHHELKDYGNDCLACMDQNPDIIPLMPPNLRTVGAFRSLLLHKPKLEEMASKQFLLYEVPRSQLHKLGEKPKTLNKKQINKQDIENTLNSKRGKRKAAAVAELVNYVYSQEEKKPKLLKESADCEEVLEAPSELEIEQMQLEGECSMFRARPDTSTTNENIIEEEDKLLFHRMLSLFFWPALFTLTKPHPENVHLAKELALEREISSVKVPDTLFPSAEQVKGKGKLAFLDIDETEHLIKKLEAVKTEKQHRRNKVYYKRESDVTEEDLQQRVYKKNLVQLKRSLIMKIAWDKRRRGLLPPKSKKRVALPKAAPKSARLAARQRRRIDVEEEVEDEDDYDEKRIVWKEEEEIQEDGV